MNLVCSRTKHRAKAATARRRVSAVHLAMGLAVLATVASQDCGSGQYYKNGKACVSCEPSYYCPQVSPSETFMRPCQPGTFSGFAAGSCTSCPAGHKCPLGTSEPVPCADGEYSLAGAAACTSCTSAPVGTLCTTSRTLQKCADGEICDRASPNNYQALPCPPYKYCPTLTTQSDCPAGTYSAAGASACTTCPIGHYCPADGSKSMAYKAMACPDGQYQDEPGQTSCKECTAGSSCADKSMKPVDCQPGTFSLAGATACSPCPAGFECTNPAAWPVVCNEGFYAVQGSSQCQVCPAGNSCAERTAANSCPEGSYSNAGEELCTVCPAGHACLDSKLPPLRCPIGWYSLPGKIACTECPKGSACPHVDREPTACRVGEYQDQQGQTACNKCPPGKYCPSVSEAPKRPATVQNSDAEQDTLIVDQFGLRTTKCPAGFACPEGIYDTKVACPAGTYSPEAFLDCHPCPAGSYCPDTVNQPIACPSGTYAKANSMSCTRCPVGHKCNDKTGRHLVKCSPGTYTRPKQYSWANHADVGIETYQSSDFRPSSTSDAELGRSVDRVVKGANAAGGETGWKLTRDLAGVHELRVILSVKFIGAVPTASNAVVRIQGKSFSNWAGACKADTWCTIDLAAPQRGPSQDNGFVVLSLPQSSEAIDVLIDRGQGILENGVAEAQCAKCEAGFACPVRQGGVGSRYSCPIGTYSLAGQTECTPCPPGKFCPVNFQAPQDCATGHVSFGMATKCDPCPAGFTCPNKNTQSLCPLYHYSKSGEQDCTWCPTGKTCQFPNQTEPVSCPAGYYADTFDFMCQPCPLGHKCSGGSLKAPVSCPAGQYAATTASDRCEPCPSGYFSTKNSSTCSPIPGGWQGTGAGRNEGITICPSGTYSVFGGGECLTCPDGFLCPPMTSEGTAWQNSCPRGSYCSQGVQTKCPYGYFGIAERATTLEEGCALCPAGYSCKQGTEDYKLHPCPRGHYCVGATSSIAPTSPYACPKGYYNDKLYGKSIADCQLCPAGHQCNVGQPDRGVICNEQDYCPRGSYPGQYPCPIGTYGGNMTGKTDVSQCVVCPPGHFCPEGSLGPTRAPKGTYQPNQGVGDLRAMYLCPPGFYCPLEAMVSYKGLPCQEGYYCPAGSSNAQQEPCPAGTWSDRKGLHDKLHCLACPKGWQCDTAATSKNGRMTQCPVNHYCPEGTSLGESVKCPSGTYNSDQMGKSLDDCIPCEPGTYCLAGAGKTPCAKGHYCPEYTNSSTEYPCPAGTFRDTTGAAHVLDCKPCGVGYQCAAGSEARVACPAGTYNNFTNKAETCSKCPAGYSCTSANVHPQPCTAGHYSAAGASVCTFCKTGHYCPYKATTEEQMLVDQVCAAGLYCVVTETNLLTGLAVVPNNDDHGCAAGHYCPRGATKQEPCPVGTYNPARARKGLVDCLLAQAGSYIDVTGATGMSGYCLPGYYCPQGSTSAKASACPAGTYRALSGGKDGAACAACQSGKYCPSRGMSEGLTCPQGYYCPVGTTDPEPCPIGTYGSKAGLKDSRECTDCPAGKFCWKQGLTSASQSENCAERYYCRGGSSTPRPTDGVTGEVCPKGSYCPAATPAPVSCGAGYFNRFLGGANKNDDCQKCWAGYYCAETTGGDPTGKCPAGAVCPEGTGIVGASPSSYSQAGYYAPEGSQQQWMCPPGTYNSQERSATCTDCPAGYLCAAFGLTDRSDCQPGYYCPQRSYFTDNGLTYHELACPRGFYQPDKNKASVSDCLECPKNKYCSKKAQGTVTGDCAAGYYCNSRSWQEKPGQSTPRTALLYGPCPPGSYCPGLAVSATPEVKCAAGTFQNITAATAQSTCEPCVEGMVCGADGSTSPTGYCEPGHFCPAGEKTNPPSGKTCDVTQYCPRGSSAALKCRTGFYQPQQNQGKCLECPSGSYCKDGEKKTCEVGYVCR